MIKGNKEGFYLLLFLFFPFLLYSAPIKLRIANKTNETLHHKIVSYNISLASTPKVMENGVEVPAQFNKETGQLLILLPGITKPNEERELLLYPEEKPSGKTDLAVEEGKDYIKISNSYFSVVHPKRGSGGFPTFISFSVSGNREQFVFEDRLYEKNEGYFTLRTDPESTARITSKGPLEVVVEARARYYSNGRYARGNARATYIYRYFAYSPYVEVSAKVEKDDDFTWSELHFLQISRKDNSFFLWAGGEPLKQGRFTDSRKGIGLDRWAMMFNTDDAIGLYSEKGISLYDGLDYYNYIQEVPTSFEEKERNLHAWLYLGAPPSNLEETFKPVKEVKMEINPIPIASPTYHSPKYKIENEHIRIDLASEDEGMGVVGLVNKLSGQPFLALPREVKPLIWRLIFSKMGSDNITIDNTQPAKRSVKINKGEKEVICELRWLGMDLGEEKGVIDVSVQIEIPIKSSLSFWRISVKNRSNVYGLWEIHFPLLYPLGKSKEVDVAVPRSNWGYLYHQLEGRVSGYYPSCDWPMQFLSINMTDSGLYLACHDPSAWTKSFFYKPGDEFYFNVRAENMGVPGSGYDSFNYVIGAFKGDWIKACKIYRDWAVKNAPWTSKGPLTKREDTPKIIKELGLWMLGGGTKDEVVPNMLRAQEFFQVPIGIHWYNWHQIGFDTEYPNYFPYKPGFPEGVKELTKRGMIAMPYINGRLWDSSLDSFKNEAIRWCAKQVNGQPYIEVYNPQVKHAVMCPATKFWQDKINSIVERLIKECGVNAIYIDQIGAAGSVLCFDKYHGHPLGGGGYWVSGYRELLRRVKEKCAGKVVITTENNAEPYMDGVDAFLIWNPRHPNEIPMMTAVYSGYTIYFSSPTHGFSDKLSFAMVQGRDFIWGCQLGWMGFELLSPEHIDKAKFLKMLGKYRMASLKYIIYGELLGEIKPLNEVPMVEGKWFMWGGGTLTAQLPSVMGTYWKGSDGTVGALIVNVSDKERVFSFAYPKELLGGARALVSEIMPEGKKPFPIPSKPNRISLSLPPFSVKVLEFKPLKEREKVSLTSIYKSIIANDLHWDLELDKPVVAEGERYDIVFKARASKPLRLHLELEGERFPIQIDGKRESKLLISKTAPEVSSAEIVPIRGKLSLGDNQMIEIVSSITVLPKYSINLSARDLRAGEESYLRISLKNNSSQHRSARLFLILPKGWECEPSESWEVNLPAGEEIICLAKIFVPSDFPAGEAKIKAYLGEQSTELKVKVLPPSPLAECPYFKPTSEDFSDLKQFQPLTISGEGVKIKDWRGEEDIMGRAWVAWDEENFYFLCEVQDDVFHQPYSGKDIWEADCIQIAFRPMGVAREPEYRGVYEFGLAKVKEGDIIYQWEPKEGNVSSGSCRINRSGNLTIYQLSIPFKAIGIDKVEPGKEIGWAFTINENDGEGFRGWLEWAGGICGGKDASLFGKLIFKK
ncbi:hypothetical protein H5T88_04500 [bacterium]|nr:hypothetical protein [bacterium]